MGCKGAHCSSYHNVIPCSSVGSSCAAWSSSNSSYSCVGHTGIRQGNIPIFDDYDVGTTIDDTNINTLRARIVEELNARKRHVWYAQKVKSLDPGEDVAEGDTIDHPQQNVLLECMKSLNEFINSKASVGEVNDPYGPKTTDFSQVKTGDLVEAENLKHLERIWSDTTRDCICYCDCSEYSPGSSNHVCSCYGYCCHYN